MRRILVLSLMVAVVLGQIACSEQPVADAGSAAPIIGVKIYQHDGDLSQLFAQWLELGINTLFVSEQLAGNDHLRELARSHRMPVFVILPIFYNPDALHEQPELYAITDRGERAVEDWVTFVCPTRETYRRQRVEEIRQLVAELRPEGISLDFIRHFAFWEMIGPERSSASLPNSCFCDSCMTAFEAAAGVARPDTVTTAEQSAAWIRSNYLEIWTRWKCGLITLLVEEIVTAATAARPELKVNLHAVPWRENDYDGAVTRVLGQDFRALSSHTDFLSPMCYSFMLRRQPAWIASVVQELAGYSECRILPSIQVREYYRDNERFDEQEFAECLAAALAPPSAGVVLWSWDAIAQEPAKQQIIKTRVSGFSS